MQSDKLSTNLTEIQIEGIRQHDLNRTRLVKLVNEKYEAKRKAKEDLWNSEKGQGNKAKKQTR